VNGHVLHRSAAEEAKFADYEKQEAKGKPYADFQVTSLKIVSDSCAIRSVRIGGHRAPEAQSTSGKRT
jgi:hypothetical protein